MKIIKMYHSITKTLSNGKDLPLLFMRLVLAYGFYIPAKTKWEDINSIGEWFESMNYPAPVFNAYLAAGTEALGVILLLLGFGTRLISIPLIITMIVAIVTVHWENGFEGGSNNGFEIPLYYIVMLIALLIYGSGKCSIDFIIEKKRGN